MKNIVRHLFFTIVLMSSIFPSDLCHGAFESQSLYFTSAGGRGYTEARKYPSTAPFIVLGVVAIAAIVAVGLYKQGSAHNH